MEKWALEKERSIKVTLAVLAALFALIHYFNHLDNVRVKQTLAFYEKFSSEPLLSSRIHVLKTWESLWVEIKQLDTRNAKEDTADLRNKWEQRVVSKIISDAQLVVQTDALFDFFGALQVCIENNICDKKSAVELLQDTAKEFLEHNCSYIIYMRYERKKEFFGVKANAFANNPCKVDTFKEPNMESTTAESVQKDTTQNTTIMPLK